MRKLLFQTYFTMLVLDYKIEEMLSKASNIPYYLQHFRGDVKNVVDLDGRDHVREGEGVLSVPLYINYLHYQGILGKKKKLA